MFLTSSNLPHYLISRGLLTSAEVISGSYSSLESRRRNRNFRVLSPSRNLFIKQIPAVFPEALECIDREAVCYRFVASDQRFSHLRTYMPRLYDYDPLRRAIVVEYLHEAENLHELHARVQSYPLAISKCLGSALGNAHKWSPRVDPTDVLPSAFQRTPPWVLTVGEDVNLRLDELPGGHRETVLAIRQNADLRHGLARVRESWQTETIIHGDIRGDNVLIISNRTETPALYLIDWELSDVGDPLWDVAGMFATYLEYWLLARHLPVPKSRNEFTDADQMKVRDAVWLALDGFWNAYCEARGLTLDEMEYIQKKCVQLTGARFVRSAFDVVAGLPHLSESATLLLAVASLIMADLDRAEREIFGFLK
jgi:tRNA A-37 threonylcarbamoyl transferase component Bud32